MGGGIIQLMAYGSQDRYLSGNPQMTFFRSVYKRHTHFAAQDRQWQTLHTALKAAGDNHVT